MANELQKLLKKFAKLEKQYDEAEGKPVLEKKILKQAEAVQAKIDKLLERY